MACVTMVYPEKAGGLVENPASVSQKASSSPSLIPPYDGLVSVKLEDSPLMNDQYCSIPNEFVDIQVGDQVRMVVGDEVALYTVKWKNAERGVVRLNGHDRLAVVAGAMADGFIQGPFVVSLTSMTDAEAKAKSELVERIVDDGAHEGFICIAPHGGHIDLKTDIQAERVLKALEGTSMWMCKGYRQGGGAFKQWHTTSNDISPNSFPALRKLVKTQRKFNRCVAFHGMAEGGVLIGGQGPMELKRALQKAIRERIEDETVSVRLATWQDCCNGLSHRNIVNWLTKDGHGGIQIEQDRKVRHRYWTCVADAVIEVLGKELGRDEDNSLFANLY